VGGEDDVVVRKKRFFSFVSNVEQVKIRGRKGVIVCVALIQTLSGLLRLYVVFRSKS
jgi:hypothetical protein